MFLYGKSLPNYFVKRFVYRLYKGTKIRNLRDLKLRERRCKRDSEARSHDHCCRGKEINIIYFECVFVALDI